MPNLNSQTAQYRLISLQVMIKYAPQSFYLIRSLIPASLIMYSILLLHYDKN